MNVLILNKFERKHERVNFLRIEREHKRIKFFVEHFYVIYYNQNMIGLYQSRESRTVHEDNNNRFCSFEIACNYYLHEIIVYNIVYTYK